MEKQTKLSIEEEELFEGRKPEVQVIKNTFVTAGALVREVLIKKTWIIPAQKLAS